MAQSYILVEGVNIYANLFDTNQLSVIRGGSFLLKEAIVHIKDHRDFKGKLTALSTGASSGFFSVTNGDSATNICLRIVEELNDLKNNFSLLPFIVEHCSADSLLAAKEQLIAQLRMSQMQSLTVIPDNKNLSNQPDGLEGRRIVGKDSQGKDLEKVIQKKNRKLSYSIYKRWQQGIKLKQDYYFKENYIKDSDKLKGYNFSNHFEDLAKKSEYSKLDGKIAVIYMDGNGFSKIQKSLLESVSSDEQENKQKEIDNKIQSWRAEFLSDLLNEMIDDNPKSSFNHAVLEQDNEKTIRFETLLWGGDEMLFVLPAWLGFEFIQYFFDKTQHWKIDEHQLTHAAGMVLCSAKTPIANIRNLAQSLAETIKESEFRGKTGREQNAWSYMILESIDYPTNSDIADFNTKHYGNQANSKPAFIPASVNGLSQKEILSNLFNNGLLPRRQLYRIVQIINLPSCNAELAELSWAALKKTINDEGLTAQEKQEIRLLQVSENTNELLIALENIAETLFLLDINQPQQRLWLWIYLYELWDYIYPQFNNQGGK